MSKHEWVRRDLRDGVRWLARRPGFTALAVLSLALGIGANTAIFSLINGVIFRPAAIERPEEVVNLYLNTPSFEFGTLSYPDYEDVIEGTDHVFSQIGAAQFVPIQIDQGNDVTLVLAEAVTGGYLPLLGVEPAVGRTLLPSDDVTPGGHPVIMLDHAYWQSAHGGEAGVIGESLRIGGRAYTIVGVGPPELQGTLRGLRPAFYAPYAMVEELMGSPMFDRRGNHSLFPKARLRPGVSQPEAEAAMAAVATRLTEDRIQNWDPAGSFAVLAQTDVLLHPPIDIFVRAGAWLLTGVVGLVLLLACTNLASFLLASAVDRRRDVAIRLALGASRGALVRRLLTESMLLSVTGGVVGIGLAVWLLDRLRSVEVPLPVPITVELGVDWVVLGFTFGLSCVAGIALGLVPALQGTRPAVADTLKSDSAGGGHAGALRWRNTLVVAQLTVSLVLLVGAGLFLRSFQQIQQVDPGFGRAPTAIASVMVPSTRFTVDEGRAYARRLLDRFRTLPGVEAVGFTDHLHLDSLGSQSTDFKVDGHEPPPRGAFSADRAEVDADFFAAAGIEIVAGRTFGDGDTPETEPVAIISRAMANRYWDDGDAVGRLLRRRDPEATPIRVVGIAADAKIRTLGEAPRDMVYRPFSQVFARSLTILARTSADPEQTALAMVTAGRQLDPDLWVLETKTMQQHLSFMLLPARMSAFGVLALVLAGVGLYGVVSYAVAQRTREVGIRMALGADGQQVVRLLAGSGLKLVALGSLFGLSIAALLSGAVASLLFGVSGFDPVTFAVVPALLVLTAIVATWLPARKASRISPVLALRSE